jgi:hypothetical protein
MRHQSSRRNRDDDDHATFLKAISNSVLGRETGGSTREVDEDGVPRYAVNPFIIS